jgi:integrase
MSARTERRERFSRSAVAALPKPQAGEVYFYDADVPQLACRVSAHGARTFYVYRKVNGSPRRIVLGQFDHSMPESREVPRNAEPLDLLGNAARLNVGMARQLARAVLAELDAGRDPTAPIKAARSELTLAEAFKLYDERHLQARGKKSADDVRAQFARYLGEVTAEKKPHGREPKKPQGAARWANRRIGSITTADVAKLHAELGRLGKRATANRVVEILSAIYGRLIAWKLYAGPNPCAGVEPYPETKRDRFLRKGELPAFFKALDAEKNRSVADFVRLCLFTGARRTNVLSMQWEHVELDGPAPTWRIPDTKSGQPVVLPLVEAAADVLRKRKPKEATGFVFPAASASGHMAPPKKQWAALLDRAGLADVTLHDLRRSLGSWAAMTNASLHIIGAALGHKDSKSTAIYARLQTDPVRAALERATGAMLAEAPKKRTRHRKPAAATK